jgi:hypothetical protein
MSSHQAVASAQPTPAADCGGAAPGASRDSWPPPGMLGRGRGAKQRTHAARCTTTNTRPKTHNDGQVSDGEALTLHDAQLKLPRERTHHSHTPRALAQVKLVHEWNSDYKNQRRPHCNAWVCPCDTSKVRAGRGGGFPCPRGMPWPRIIFTRTPLPNVRHSSLWGTNHTPVYIPSPPSSSITKSECTGLSSKPANTNRGGNFNGDGQPSTPLTSKFRGWWHAAHSVSGWELDLWLCVRKHT